MALQTYQAKRDFRVTPEPRGKVARTGKSLAFVIQKHAASHLHYDFRLELDGVLLSWAVPKGPSLDPADKRLAMHVEDHPTEYGKFEGVIPAGEYGGGTVMLWDRGTWEPEGDPRAGLAKGEMKFRLHGEKLQGSWVLVRTRGSKYGGKSGDKAWLLIKHRDAAARAGKKPIVDTETKSVDSGRTMDEIATGKSREWSSKRSVAANARAIPAKAPPADVPEGAKKSALPATLKPVLATLVEKIPAGDGWIHELKYDGYRILGRIEGGRCRLYSRNGKDWTQALHAVAADLERLPVRQAWIDGELVVLDAQGRSRFQLLQNALSGESGKAFSYFAFDLPFVDGIDLRGATLAERKARLRKVVGKGVGCVRVGPEFVGAGEEFLRQSCSLHLEGALSKRVDSTYASGMRTRDWVKVKCMKRQEMVIGGYTNPKGSRSGFGALLLGTYEDGKLRYSGKVGTGFDERMLESLAKKLRALERDTPAFANPPKGHEFRGAHWVAPQLVAEVSFTEWSDGGALRHPSFVGLRTDKAAREVVREEAAEGKEAAVPIAKVKPRTTTKRDVLPLTHPDKLYFPEAKLAKRDIAQYYVDVAPWILPHLKGRPLSLVRCPDGWKGQCFYQKNAEPRIDKSVDRIPVQVSDGKATYMSASSPEALVSLVQWGVIEMHPWGSRQPKLDRPDRLIFDFDPDDKLPWAKVVEGVGLLRTLLEEIGLRGFLKTTGGKGLHVVIPIRPTLGWDEAKAFTKSVANVLSAGFPDRFTSTMAKDKRHGRIFIDYLRNADGATAVAPYVVRARKNAPVATPIEWEELKQDVRFDFFNVRNVPTRLSKVADPWAEFAETKQSITKAMIKRVAGT